MATIDERIDVGVETLDKYLGKSWPHAIDLDRLDLGDATRCVLGQLWGDYGYGMAELHGLDPWGWNDELDPLAREAGFAKRQEYWGTLTDRWRTRLADLQASRRFRPGRRLVELLAGK